MIERIELSTVGELTSLTSNDFLVAVLETGEIGKVKTANSVETQGCASALQLEDLNAEHITSAEEVRHHIDNAELHLTAHNELTGIGNTSHDDIDSHIANNALHVVSHLNLTNIGNNTHAVIDSHLASVGKHVNMTPWVNITLLNGWAQVNGKRTIAYKLLATGLVVFKGRISGANSTSNIFFVLPEGSRPGATIDQVVWGDGVATLLNIDSAGNCSAAVSGTTLSVEGVFFSV